jgi:hypothetical protein
MGVIMSVPYLTASSMYDNVCGCRIFIMKHQIKPQEKINKIVLLNALVPVSDKPAILISTPIDLEEVRRIVQRAEVIESYIGHESTARVLSELLSVNIPMNRGMYVPSNEDLAIIARLKRRLEKPEDVKSVKPEDLEFLLVRYYVGVEVIEYK